MSIPAWLEALRAGKVPANNPVAAVPIAEDDPAKDPVKDPIAGAAAEIALAALRNENEALKAKVAQHEAAVALRNEIDAAAAELGFKGDLASIYASTDMASALKAMYKANAEANVQGAQAFAAAVATSAGEASTSATDDPAPTSREEALARVKADGFSGKAAAREVHARWPELK